MTQIQIVTVEILVDITGGNDQDHLQKEVQKTKTEAKIAVKRKETKEEDIPDPNADFPKNSGKIESLSIQCKRRTKISSRKLYQRHS